MKPITGDNYLRLLRKAEDSHFFAVIDLFLNPISALVQRVYFPSSHKQQLDLLIDFLHKLDNRKLTESNDSAHNKIYAPIWDKLRTDVLEPLEELTKHLEDKDLGEAAGYHCIADYGKALNELSEKMHNVFVFATVQMGRKCIHCKDGLCVGGFTQKETKCDGSEYCECWDIGLS